MAALKPIKRSEADFITWKKILESVLTKPTSEQRTKIEEQKKLFDKMVVKND